MTESVKKSLVDNLYNPLSKRYIVVSDKNTLKVSKVELLSIGEVFSVQLTCVLNVYFTVFDFFG